ncbi:hypothetical protein P40081_27885 [Paenibacillus sp. FSL P4-0081]|uniref:helix-turn-helix domain-containing protein n=1 Tax=Paenibacillus sp. FSL R10-2199 TaxID=2975348 RepID=UPI0004F919ED|nr:AraC family transcriptional regulator [Paenibacillus sp. FSL P4-0081]AIQ31542.1 hypothetical protein P40081_27885 [Paenibacillus sp. FSL P4-0081]
MLSYVEDGMPEMLESLLDNIQTRVHAFPIVTSDAVRSFKNIFIFSSGVVSRFAMKGGLNLAEQLDMNCSYICRHFKQEIGKTIIQYVNEVKILESKRLLATTNTDSNSIKLFLSKLFSNGI